MKSESNAQQRERREPKLLRTPWKHQIPPVRDAAFKKRMYLSFIMGTGKTLTALAILNRWQYMKGRQLDVIVTCPKIGVMNWRDEVAKTLPQSESERVVVLLGPIKERVAEIRKHVKANRRCIYVTNLEGLRYQPFFNALKSIKASVVINDEAHRCKNHKSVQAKRVCALADAAEYCVALSGTPIPNDLTDLYMQARILSPSIFGTNYYQFLRRYFTDANAGTFVEFADWQPKVGAFESMMGSLSEYMYMAGVEALHNVPEMVRTQSEIEMTPQVHKSYHEMRKHFITWRNESDLSNPVVATAAIEKMIRLSQICNGVFVSKESGECSLVPCAKDDELDTDLGDILSDPAAQVIVWTNSVPTLEKLERIARRHAEVAFIRGGQSSAVRYDEQQRFEDGAARVMIATVQAASVAINLTSASHMIYYSRGFSLEQDQQSEARAYRSGQTKSVVRRNYVTLGTVEEQITAVLANKCTVQDAVYAIR